MHPLMTISMSYFNDIMLEIYNVEFASKRNKKFSKKISLDWLSVIDCGTGNFPSLSLYLSFEIIFWENLLGER